jgi:hypothetical protein
LNKRPDPRCALATTKTIKNDLEKVSKDSDGNSLQLNHLSVFVFNHFDVDSSVEIRHN